MIQNDRDSRTEVIIGAAIEVHRHLGCGFLEAVYQEALALELTDRHIPFEREVLLPVRYKDRLLTCSYRADFLCSGGVLVEIKALSEIGVREHAQVVNYLKATGIHLALVINFGTTKLQVKRLVWGSNPTATAE
jgi:GxxExxY protein